ncbi:MAG: hypothetical protein L0H83_06465, partial [Salinisphaera sp.]|nr:hypothetical protein [Salinisphaera sp.]
MPPAYVNPLSPPLPAAGSRQRWPALPGCAPALALSRLAAQHRGPLAVIVADEQHAYRLEDELRFFCAGESPVAHFPDWETLPYDVFSPHADIVSDRLAVLHRLPQQRRGVLLVAADTLLQRVPPPEFIDARVLLLQVGDTLDPLAMRGRLEAAGYAAVSEVRGHGEYALRGSVLDLYPMGSAQPFRLDLFDDEIESIRRFDPENQRSVEKLERIRLLPAREYPLDDDAIQAFRQRWRQRFAGDPSASLIYREISRGVPPGGIEYYLPLFFERSCSLLDYLPDDALVVELGTVDAALEHRVQRQQQRRGTVCARHNRSQHDDRACEPEHHRRCARLGRARARAARTGGAVARRAAPGDRGCEGTAALSLRQRRLGRAV